MILDQSGLVGIRLELEDFDAIAKQNQFLRWQWEYYRATYDHKIDHEDKQYYLRINSRAISGKLESPEAILEIEHVYLGRATYPHGLDYTSPIPDEVLAKANQQVNDLLRAAQTVSITVP